MRIGVVADTHSRELPAQMLNDFQGVDLIVHAGDFCDLEAVRELERLGKEIKGVYGNMDDAEVRGKFPARRILEISGCRLGLVHGDGPPQQVLDLVRSEFAKDAVDAVIFGHTHHPFNETIDNVLYFNPGSPNDEILAPYRSYGILDVDQRRINAKIIKVGS